MKRHIQNLQRLCQKLETRYGNDDELVAQLRHEIDTLEAKQLASTENRHHNWRQQEWRTTPATEH